MEQKRVRMNSTVLVFSQKDYNGPPLFKQRLLAHLGWKVISIDYQDADKNRYSHTWLDKVVQASRRSDYIKQFA